MFVCKSYKRDHSVQEDPRSMDQHVLVDAKRQKVGDDEVDEELFKKRNCEAKEDATAGKEQQTAIAMKKFKKRWQWSGASDIHVQRYEVIRLRLC